MLGGYVLGVSITLRKVSNDSKAYVWDLNLIYQCCTNAVPMLHQCCIRMYKDV